jgi:alpha-1,2-glucosyltransferase
MAGTCTVLELRTIDCLAIIALLFASCSCRSLIKSRNNMHREAMMDLDWDAVHTAVNICLFPPLFFFSGLYYTDVVSTLVVVGAYRHFLRGSERTTTSVFKNFGIYTWGISALFMRQTNIFWVAVFLGGLETTRAFKEGSFSEGGEQGQKLRFGEFIKQYAHGELHDPPLRNASVLGTWASPA